MSLDRLRCRLSLRRVGYAKAGGNNAGLREWIWTEALAPSSNIRDGGDIDCSVNKARAKHRQAATRSLANLPIPNSAIGVDVLPVAMTSAITSPTPRLIAKPSPLKPKA